MCDAASVSTDDLVTFEIRYADRVGENYMVRHASGQRWSYFPRLTRDEAVLIKCWDSRELRRRRRRRFPRPRPGRRRAAAPRRRRGPR